MSDPEFSFAGLEITDKTTAQFTFYGIEGEPSIEVKPARETTKGYYNAILRRTKKNMRRNATQVSAQQLSDQRDEDRSLFAKYIVVSWLGVKDTSGAAVPCTERNVYRFLKAMPDWMFDEVRGFCGDANNFLSVDDMTEEEVEETGKP